MLSVAKSEHEKLQADAEQRAELSRDNLVSEKMTGGEALAIRQRQFQNNVAIKKSTKHYLEQIVLMLKRSWPELEGTELRKINVEECQLWAGKLSNAMSAPRFNATLSMLRSLLEIAVEQGARRTNPAAKIKRMRPEWH